MEVTNTLTYYDTASVDVKQFYSTDLCMTAL
jgi:hypothetical protein